MSISSVQYENKKQEAIQSLVKKGIEPNNYEVNTIIAEYFDTKTLGIPVYSPIEQEPYEQSSKDDYNHNFKTFNEDINTAFQVDTQLNNKAVAIQEYYDREKNKIFNALKELSLKVLNTQDAIKNTSCVKQYCESFDDMYNIEFYGNIERNIPYTTSFIDLMQKNVYTDKTKAQINRLSILDATISVNNLDIFNSYEKEGISSNILSDIISDNYIIRAKSTNSDKKTIDLVVDLGKQFEFNTVLFKFSCLRDLNCILYLSDDNKNFLPVYDLSGSELIEWNFTKQTKRYIKISIIKNTPDGSNVADTDVEVYEYYYIFKNISIALENYQSKSIFVSKLIEFDDLTSTIKLDAEDMIYNHTNISYFIGFDNEKDKIGWDTIENHKDYDLFMFQKLGNIANIHLEEFGIHDDIIDAYSVFELPKKTNLNSLSVIPGYNRWHVARYNRLTGDSNEDGFSINTGDFSDYIDKCSKTNLFMDCENYDSFKLQSNVLYIFTQYVLLKEPKALYNTYIKVMDNECKIKYKDCEIRIFVNGYEINTGDNDLYSFALRKGTNKIQIAIYNPLNTAVICTLLHNINFKALTHDVYALPKMKYTSNNVLDKVLGENYEYYTIKNNKVYVKCNPRDMIVSGLEDMGYYITFSCLKPDMMDYFKDNKIKFRIMAIFNSDDINLSPKLLNFRLTGR